MADCYLAADHLMLAAHASGFGTCPIGAARDWLNLPETQKLLGIEGATAVFPLVLGYPAEHPPLTPRRTPRILVWR